MFILLVFFSKIKNDMMRGIKRLELRSYQQLKHIAAFVVFSNEIKKESTLEIQVQKNYLFVYTVACKQQLVFFCPGCPSITVFTIKIQGNLF